MIRVRPINSTEQTLQGYSRCLKQESAQSITWIGQAETRFTFDYVACESITQVRIYISLKCEQAQFTFISRFKS